MTNFNFAQMTDEQRNELFTLPESRWNDSKPYYWHDYQREEAKTDIANKLIKYAFAGLDDTSDLEMCRRIMATMKSKDDRMALAEMLINFQNYYDFQPDYSNLGQDEERETVLRESIDKYNGLDAYVFAARLEFAENIAMRYADVDELIELFS